MNTQYPEYSLLRNILPLLHENLTTENYTHLKEYWRIARESDCEPYDSHGLSKIEMALDTALTFAREIDPDASMLTAILAGALMEADCVDIDKIKESWGPDVASLVEGFNKVAPFTLRHTAAQQENFRGLLLSLAGDIRIVIVMIVRNLVLMRHINLHPDTDWVKQVAEEAKILYAQLAHRLGLYGIKSVLEDLSLKYTDRAVYKQIASRLNETKRSRDAYIQAFIGPVKKKLEEAGLKFTIKGRTKTISSIWNKIKNKKVDINHIYDLFAIRVILDTPEQRHSEQEACWKAFAILANMYTPDKDRMRDWLSFPKENGYESLHTTVLGPDDKWVEVQFRTRRMDLVAEKGLAAHWRYKGGKSDGTDKWMNRIRDVLESAEKGPMELMKNMQIQADGNEVYAFTPMGDLLRLPPGSTLLDFAFAIHTGVGCKCTGGNVNGKYEKISYKVQSGDTIRVLTSAAQTPRPDWLQIATSSKARNKIRQSLNESKHQKATLGKELIERRLRNRKIEIDEASLSKLILKNGYSHISDFMADVADNRIDLPRFLEMCKEEALPAQSETVAPTAEEFKFQNREAADDNDEEVLVIGRENIKGLKYVFARCCSPMPGDGVFGFICSDGAVKIHRNDCPNAKHIRQRYPYRIIGVKWSGKKEDASQITLRIIGRDDIGIVTNITSVIDKEPDVWLHNVSIDSHDGLFCGFIGLRVSSGATLASLLRKLSSIKGVKEISRI